MAWSANIKVWVSQETIPALLRAKPVPEFLIFQVDIAIVNVHVTDWATLLGFVCFVHHGIYSQLSVKFLNTASKVSMLNQ